MKIESTGFDLIEELYTPIEIGPFGKIEHLVAECIVEDCWKDNEGEIRVRRIPVPPNYFTLTSVGLLIYKFDVEGEWYGSEKIRRG